MWKSHVSIVALGLVLGAPAFVGPTSAQTTSGTTVGETETTGTVAGQTGAATGEAGTSVEVTTAIGAERIEADEIKDMFSEAGFEQTTEIEAHLARATMTGGRDALVLVGPKDLQADKSVDVEESDLRDRFQQAGIVGLQKLGEAHVVRADLDDDHYIYALAADQLSDVAGPDLSGQAGITTGQTEAGTTVGQTGTETTVGQTGTETTVGQTDTDVGTTIGQTGTGTEQAGMAVEPTAEEIVGDIEQAGLQDAEEFNGRLVKARSADGAPVYMLIAPKDMKAETGVDVQQTEIQDKLQNAGFRDVEFIEDAQLVRGSLEDKTLFVLSGRDLAGIKAGTTVQQ